MDSTERGIAGNIIPIPYELKAAREQLSRAQFANDADIAARDTIRLYHRATCYQCRGRGTLASKADAKCLDCNGSGSVYVKRQKRQEP